MTKHRNPAEMPFLDHLEELRWRILWSLLALVVGIVVGFAIVQRFDVLGVLKAPIVPYLPDGRLHVTHPTEPFFITFKLAFVVGLILAAPVILTQVWAFLAPALYEHERRYIIPALAAGAVLFGGGVFMAYRWAFPAALKFLLTQFQREDLEFIITANQYLGFEVQFLVAFGLAFELPLVMVLLSGLGLIRPQTFAKQRPIALLVLSIVAAFATPADVASMILMLIPLLVLYEAGILIGRLVARKPRQIASIALLLTLIGAGEVSAQDPTRPPSTQRDSAVADSLRSPMDSARAKELGLPSQPSRSFPAADSVIRALLERSGYTATRYAGDSIVLFGSTQEVVLLGTAFIDREGTMLEADIVTFAQAECRLLANGSPILFDKGTVLAGEGMRYNTCTNTGTVAKALTSFQQRGVNWFLRGGLEVDSASIRIYGKANDITSCNLPTPHYHIAANNVKWVSNTIMVARPAVLFVRDVPVMWLPFIFQDMRPGRRSGILVPRFGLSDLVRPNEGYRRHVSNIGFYLALSDYTDVQFSMDWFSGNYIGLNGQFRYRWLDRFMTGGLNMSRLWESSANGVPGDRSLRLQWGHQQSFDRRTRLSADVDYATSARVIERNTTDPFLQTATLGSRVNFSKQFDWGTLSAGGNLSQDLSNGGATQTLPTVSLTPSPIDIGSSITWSPTLSFTNAVARGQRPGVALYEPVPGGPALTDTVFPSNRNTSLAIGTPLRVGRWNWQNSLTITDLRTEQPPPRLVLPDPENPADSVTRYYNESFETGIDWNTGINLPNVFSGSWKIQPSLGIRNTTGGPFLLRNRFTGGNFVSQGKRASFSASMTPTFFGFFPGVGPLSRIRHAVSPLVNWSYSPSASVPEEYARALNPGGRLNTFSPPVHTVSLGLSQTFEGKLRPAEGDTTTDPRNARKVKILSLQTSPLSYDFQQAKQPGRTGWTTQAISNQVTSDLLPGFTLNVSHELWDGPVGYDTTRFDLFFTSISARFSLSSRTFQSIASVFGGGDLPEPEGPGADRPEQIIEPIQPVGSGGGPSARIDQFLDRTQGGGVKRGRGFQANVTYDQTRQRPTNDDAPTTNANQTLGLTMGFSPTVNWSLSWSTQYNITTGDFGQHVLRFDRDLHRWRATFAFTKAPNGNFAFNFFITLTDEPELKFQYDQRTLNRR